MAYAYYLYNVILTHDEINVLMVFSDIVFEQVDDGSQGFRVFENWANVSVHNRNEEEKYLIPDP